MPVDPRLPEPNSLSIDSAEFPPSLLFDDVATFADHLEKRKDHIIKSLKKLFQTLKENGAPVKVESERLEELQGKIRSLLITEKANRVEIARLEKEVEGANSRLTEATVKYLTAEKKVDRLKSQTLAKIERQAMFNATGGDKKESEEAQSDKDKEVNAKVAEGHIADVELARKEAQAAVNKLKEEIATLQIDNAKLSEQVTTFTIKVRHRLWNMEERGLTAGIAVWTVI